MALERKPDWQDRLAALIERVERRPFRWGRWDCATFAAAAVHAVTGERVRPAAQYSSATGAARWLSSNGYSDVLGVADAILGARVPLLHCRRGDIVTDGERLGVLWHHGGAVGLFVGGDRRDAGRAQVGLVALPIGALRSGWRVG